MNSLIQTQRQLLQTTFQDKLTKANRVLLLDVSSSMDRYVQGSKRRIDILRTAVSNLSSERIFVFASFTVEIYPGMPIPEPHGGTNMLDALRTLSSLGIAKCVLVTDGEPTSNHADTIDFAVKHFSSIEIIFTGSEDTPIPYFLTYLAHAMKTEVFHCAFEKPKQIEAAIRGLLESGEVKKVIEL